MKQSDDISAEFKDEMNVDIISRLIGPSVCVRCHGNKVSTINGVIFSSLFSLSARLLFSQKGLS